MVDFSRSDNGSKLAVFPSEFSDTVPAIFDVEPGFLKVKVSVVTDEEDSCSLKLALIAEFTSMLIDPSSGLVPVIAGGVVYHQRYLSRLC